MDPAIQEQIGRYKIAGELGRGAMGVVYRATDPSIGRTVAIKTIRIRDINDTQARDRLRERLFREARSAGVLSHPNIVTIYDMDEDEGLAYIAMAFVNGPTLEKILASEEPLSGARMLRILRQSAAALDYAHGRGIVHRDVKPANIMTDEDGSVKITDFGIAKIATALHATAADAHNETKTISGTPNYMSPEQVQGYPVDGRSDQFSLAVIAWEILTGERPFSGEHLSTIVYKVVSEEPPAAHRINGTLTQRIDDVLRKALSKRPEDRFPNCSSFVGALELACAESRGWKTLPAGAAAELPTIGVDRPAARPVPPVTLGPLPQRARQPEHPRSSSRLLPLFLSILLVSALAAFFVYQSGLAGKAPQSDEPRAALPPETKPPDPAPETAPPRQEEPKPDEPKRDEPPVQAPPPVEAASDSPVPVRPEPFKPASSASAQHFPPAQHLQDIWITTIPSGARVVLDENPGLSCLGPCQLHGAPGVHRLAVSLPGYLNEIREIRVEDAALEVPPVILRQPSGTLMLTTIPAGANIRINGEPFPKQTPAEISLKPGSYSITVEKDGASRTERILLRESPFYLRIPLAH